ncbi:MAG: uL15 family ribosomal protein [Candidatus Woesearchaeota archaeon]
MTVKRRKKSTRSYGTHGWGKNKHRNSGSKGGFGNAGTGKKSDNKKTAIWATDYFGKHGFVSRKTKIENLITIKDLEDKLPGLIEQKKATQEAGVIAINLGAMGYTKLLGTGKITKKLKITIPTATAGATEKIKAAGGEVVAK